MQERAEQHKVRFAESRHFAEGGAGSTDLARQVMAAAENKTLYKPLYDLDIPALHGRPRDFQVTVRNLQVNSGAGFLVVLTGAIMRMPGLPRQPLAQDVKYLADGTIEGIG